jgi:hypothetical protein
MLPAPIRGVVALTRLHPRRPQPNATGMSLLTQGGPFIAAYGFLYAGIRLAASTGVTWRPRLLLHLIGGVADVSPHRRDRENKVCAIRRVSS